MQESNRDFEIYFILSLIYNKNLRKYCIDKIKSDWLLQWEAKYLFELVIKMEKNNRPVNFISVSENIKRDISLSDDRVKVILSILIPYIEEPTSPILSSMLDAVIPIVEDEVGKTLLMKGILKAQDLLEKEKISDVFGLFKQIEQQTIYDKRVNVNFWNKAKDICKSGGIGEIKKGIPTGIYGEDRNFNKDYLDQNMISKGIGRGQIAMIVGLASSGKTTLKLNMAAYQSLFGYTVNYYTLEMPPDYMSLRLISILTDIPTFELPKRMDEANIEINKIIERYPNHKELKIAHFKAHELTPAMLAQDLNRDSNEGRIVDSIFIDYADIMGTTRRFKERRHEIGYNIEEIRGVASEFKCSAITSSQSNREGFKKKKGGREYTDKILDRSNLSEDWSKIFTVDLMFSINAKTVEGEDIDHKKVEREEVEIFVDKNRFGPEGFTLTMDVNRKTGRFFDPFPIIT